MDASLITITKCPVCSSEKIQFVFQAIDHTLSGKPFDIWQCEDCSLRFTQDAPAEDQIGSYYRSDNYISHTDTSKGLINSLYHLVRRKTLGDKFRLICRETGKKTGNLLDVGAGAGSFAHHMQLNGWQVTGLEPDQQARERAATLHGMNLLPVEALRDQEENSFDAITLWHVLEHVHDLHGYLETLKKIIRPGGCIFIAVPNYTSYDGSVYKDLWAAYDVPRHLYHFSPASMRRLFQVHQLIPRTTRPMWYDSFYISLLSEKYKETGAATIRGFWTGSLSNLEALFNRDRCSSLVYVAGK
jgi:SAM-dependent methyltransferase